MPRCSDHKRRRNASTADGCAGTSSKTTTLASLLRTSPPNNDRAYWMESSEAPSRFAEPTAAQRLSTMADLVWR